MTAAAQQRRVEPVRTFHPALARAEAPAKPEPAPEGFVPVRVWTAGPNTSQEKIVVPGTVHGIKPRPDGSYLLRTPQEVEIAKKALGKRFWTDDVPEGEESPKCETCGWTTRSWRAYQWHANHAHGRPQGV